jgi:hypothetical protein
MVHGGGDGLNPNLAGLQSRKRHGGPRQHLGRAMACHLDRLGGFRPRHLAC